MNTRPIGHVVCFVTAASLFGCTTTYNEVQEEYVAALQANDYIAAEAAIPGLVAAANFPPFFSEELKAQVDLWRTLRAYAYTQTCDNLIAVLDAVVAGAEVQNRVKQAWSERHDNGIFFQQRERVWVEGIEKTLQQLGYSPAQSHRAAVLVVMGNFDRETSKLDLVVDHVWPQFTGSLNFENEPQMMSFLEQMLADWNTDKCDQRKSLLAAQYMSHPMALGGTGWDDQTKGSYQEALEPGSTEAVALELFDGSVLPVVHSTVENTCPSQTSYSNELLTEIAFCSSEIASDVAQAIGEIKEVRYYAPVMEAYATDKMLFGEDLAGEEVRKVKSAMREAARQHERELQDQANREAIMGAIGNALGQIVGAQ